MAYGDCSGQILPKKRTVNCQDSVTQLEDCCEIVNLDDEIMLYEHVKPGAKGYYYWFFLKADDKMPIVVCALEQYADKIADWSGRRADYLAIGRYEGYCCIVLIELRHVLLSEKQQDDKLQQLEKSIETLVNTALPTFKQSKIFPEAGYPPPAPQDYKIVGVVIPTDRSKERLNRKQTKQIGQYSCFMTTLLSARLTRCRISWSELLDAIGVVSSGN